MDIPAIPVLVGAVIGIMTTAGVYPYVLKRRADRLSAQADKLRAECPAGLGEPNTNYLALVVYELTSAYQCLERKEMDEAKAILNRVLANYSEFLTMKAACSLSEQSTLDSIRKICGESEALRLMVDEQVKRAKGKTVGQVLQELEREMANPPSDRTR